MSVATETKQNTWSFSQHFLHEKKQAAGDGRLKEKHYTVGQAVIWRHDDGEIQHGNVTRVDSDQILVQWEDCVRPASYSSKRDRENYFDKIEMKDMWVSQRGIYPVTEVEYEEIKN